MPAHFAFVVQNGIDNRREQRCVRLLKREYASRLQQHTDVFFVERITGCLCIDVGDGKQSIVLIFDFGYVARVQNVLQPQNGYAAVRVQLFDFCYVRQTAHTQPINFFGVDVGNDVGRRVANELSGIVLVEHQEFEVRVEVFVAVVLQLFVQQVVVCAAWRVSRFFHHCQCFSRMQYLKSSSTQTRMPRR